MEGWEEVTSQYPFTSKLASLSLLLKCTLESYDKSMIGHCAIVTQGHVDHH